MQQEQEEATTGSALEEVIAARLAYDGGVVPEHMSPEVLLSTGDEVTVYVLATPVEGGLTGLSKVLYPFVRGILAEGHEFTEYAVLTLGRSRELDTGEVGDWAIQVQRGDRDGATLDGNPVEGNVPTIMSALVNPYVLVPDGEGMLVLVPNDGKFDVAVVDGDGQQGMTATIDDREKAEAAIAHFAEWWVTSREEEGR